MKNHKLRETPVSIGAKIDKEMQTIFNFLRKHYGFTSNSVLLRFLAKRDYEAIRKEQSVGVPQA